jgi:hypothetical protein
MFSVRGKLNELQLNKRFNCGCGPVAHLCETREPRLLLRCDHASHSEAGCSLAHAGRATLCAGTLRFLCAALDADFRAARLNIFDGSGWRRLRSKRPGPVFRPAACHTFNSKLSSRVRASSPPERAHALRILRSNPNRPCRRTDSCFGKMPEHYRLEAGDPASIRFRLRGIK